MRAQEPLAAVHFVASADVIQLQLCESLALRSRRKSAKVPCARNMDPSLPWSHVHIANDPYYQQATKN